MAVDFEAVKKLPADAQIAEFKKIVAAANIFVNDSKKKIADLEKEEKSEERDKKIAEAKKLMDEAIRDRNSAEQLLARAEIEAKALETVLAQTRGAARQEEGEKQARERDQLENIIAQERTREDERKRDEKRPEDAYKPSKGYETQSVYEQQNKFYENNNPSKQREDDREYKTDSQRNKEQDILHSSMYSGSDGKGYR